MNQVLQKLIASKEQINPAVELHQRMLEMESRGELTPLQLLLMGGEIEKTVDLTNKYSKAVRSSYGALKESEAIADKRVPTGF
jgi:hypothetical protein